MSNRNHNENYNEYVLNISQNLLDELVEKERGSKYVGKNI